MLSPEVLQSVPITGGSSIPCASVESGRASRAGPQFSYRGKSLHVLNAQRLAAAALLTVGRSIVDRQAQGVQFAFTQWLIKIQPDIR